MCSRHPFALHYNCEVCVVGAKSVFDIATGGVTKTTTTGN